jgi:hypothetical protein
LFFFEINRHGARGPYYTGSKGIALDGFKVPKEQLTPMGMRQRMLLGKYNKMNLKTKNFCICDQKQDAFI